MICKEGKRLCNTVRQDRHLEHDALRSRNDRSVSPEELRTRCHDLLERYRKTELSIEEALAHQSSCPVCIDCDEADAWHYWDFVTLAHQEGEPGVWFAPTESVPETSRYEVLHDQHRTDHIVLMQAGYYFPPCRKCGDRVRFQPVTYGEEIPITADQDFRQGRRKATADHR